MEISWLGKDSVNFPAQCCSHSRLKRFMLPFFAENSHWEQVNTAESGSRYFTACGPGLKLSQSIVEDVMVTGTVPTMSRISPGSIPAFCASDLS